MNLQHNAWKARSKRMPHSATSSSELPRPIALIPTNILSAVSTFGSKVETVHFLVDGVVTESAFCSFQRILQKPKKHPKKQKKTLVSLFGSHQ
jgi:hypothetical protein